MRFSWSGPSCKKMSLVYGGSLLLSMLLPVLCSFAPIAPFAVLILPVLWFLLLHPSRCLLPAPLFFFFFAPFVPVLLPVFCFLFSFLLSRLCSSAPFQLCAPSRLFLPCFFPPFAQLL